VLETILEIPDNHVFVVRKGTEEVLIRQRRACDLGGSRTRRMMVRGIDDLV